MQSDIRLIHVPSNSGKGAPNIGKFSRNRPGEGAQRGEREFPKKLGNDEDGASNGELETSQLEVNHIRGTCRDVFKTKEDFKSGVNQVAL